MEEPRDRPALLDPSLFLTRSSLTQLMTRVDAVRDYYDLYVSATLVAALETDSWIPYFRDASFGPKKPAKNAVSLNDVRNSVTTLLQRRAIRIYERPEERRADLVVSRLEEKHLPTHVSEMLIDEWTFLQEHSIVPSRIRKPFTEFTKAGAVVVEFGRDTASDIVAEAEEVLDKTNKNIDSTAGAITRKTLKKGAHDVLRHQDYWRALAKWIAFGGPFAAKLFFPETEWSASALSTTFFFIADP